MRNDFSRESMTSVKFAFSVFTEAVGVLEFQKVLHLLQCFVQR